MNIKKKSSVAGYVFFVGRVFRPIYHKFRRLAQESESPPPLTQFFVEQSLYLFEVRHNPEKDQWNTRVFCVTLACAWVIDQNRKTQQKKWTVDNQKKENRNSRNKKTSSWCMSCYKESVWSCSASLNHISLISSSLLLVDLPPLPYSFLVILFCCKASKAQKHKKKTHTLRLSLWAGFSGPYITNLDV